MGERKIMFDEWTSDDTLLLFDYFKERNTHSYSLKTILTELNLLDKLGQDMIYDGADVFYVSVMPNGSERTHDFDIAIDAIIDLCVILLETFRVGEINIKDLYQYEKGEYLSFSIQAEKSELILLLNEFKAFIDNPMRYNLAEMMDEDELMKLSADCNEVYEEIQSYLTKY